MTPLTLEIVEWIKKIPKGKVATYGQIAKLAGRPGAARRVVWVLHACTKSHRLPWQRVIGAKGKVSFKSESPEFKKQLKLLKSEGVPFGPANQVNLDRALWKPRVQPAARVKNQPRMFSDVSS